MLGTEDVGRLGSRGERGGYLAARSAQRTQRACRFVCLTSLPRLRLFFTAVSDVLPPEVTRECSAGSL